MNEEAQPRARRRTARRVIDWHRAAELLAQGTSPADVAGRLGCSRAALTRRQRHDPVFQTWIARCREADPKPDTRRLAGLRPTLHDTIEKEVHAGNLRVILWLADRLKLVTPPSEQTPGEELRQILSGLTAEELREFEELRDTP
jgi:hypothetical protein